MSPEANNNVLLYIPSQVNQDLLCSLPLEHVQSVERDSTVIVSQCC